MNVWIKRGLRTALLSGGLLALGAGVASADENSIEVTAPATVCGTGIGVLGEATASCTTPGGASAGSGGAGSVVEVTAPVNVCGTGIGVLGDATASCTTSAGASAGSGGAGSVVEVTAPLTACGTGIGVLDEASATCTGPATPAGPGASTPPGTRIACDAAPTYAGGSVRLHLVPASLPVFMSGGSAPRASDPDTTAGELAYTGIGLALPALIGLLALVVGLGMTLTFRRGLDSAVR